MEYLYQAKTREGQITEGAVNASSEQEAVDVLHSRSLVIIALEPKKKGALDIDVTALLSRVSNKDLVAFTRQFATLVDADVPLVDSLRTLAKQNENPAFQKILRDITDEVDGGAALSKAFGRYPKIFSDFFISLLKSGEASGKLHDVLLYLADYLERAASLRSKTAGALAYPIFIFLALIGVTIFLMVTVMPQLLGILKEVGVQDLPITTKILIFMTDLVNRFIYLFVLAILALTTLGYKYVKTPNGKFKWDAFKLKVPVLGKVSRDIYIARMAEALATLMKSDIAILNALEIAGDVVSNEVYKRILLDARDGVASGGNISSVFSKHKEIPPLVTQMVLVGESTGKIDFMLQHLSKFYQSQSETTLQGLSSLLEPVLVLIMGVAVAILVASVLLPIYNLVGVG